MSDLWRECGKCHDLWPLDAVTCKTCGHLIVLSKANLAALGKKAA